MLTSATVSVPRLKLLSADFITLEAAPASIYAIRFLLIFFILNRFVHSSMAKLEGLESKFMSWFELFFINHAVKDKTFLYLSLDASFGHSMRDFDTLFVC